MERQFDSRKRKFEKGRASFNRDEESSKSSGSKQSKYWHKTEDDNSSTRNLDFSNNVNNRDLPYQSDYYPRTHSDELDEPIVPNLKETVLYFERILTTLKQGMDNESRDSFSSNILNESRGFEIELSCHGTSSRCIELLLSQCKDREVIVNFLTAFQTDLFRVCTSVNGSHVVEAVIYLALQSLQGWSSVLQSDDEDEKKLVTDVIMSLYNIGLLFESNLQECFKSSASCHVLCTLIQVLGGQYSDRKKFASKKSWTHKKYFHEQFLGEDSYSKSNAAIKLEEVPKFFIDVLKKLSKSLIRLEDISTYVSDSSADTVIEALLSILKIRHPKCCEKIIRFMATQLFSRKNSEGIPYKLVHKNTSFVVEKMFEASSEELQNELWNNYFVECYDQLVVHSIGNYIVQRLFDITKSESQFITMADATSNVFDKVLQSRYYGIFLSIATACNRLKVHQAQFMGSMMQCLQCSDLEEKQLYIVPLTLGFQTYNAYLHKNSELSTSHIEICLHGSLLLQAMLQFSKPKKLVKSMLNMKPEELAFLASNVQGSHVLRCYFESSTVGEKNKDKLIHHMKPVFSSMACDKEGNLTLSRIWVLLSLKQKGLLLSELTKNTEELQMNNYATTVLQKFGAFHYKHNYEKWKSIQINLLEK